MRLLVLTVDWEPIEGGIASLSAGVARALARRGHEVTVLAPARPRATAAAFEDGVHVLRWRGYGLGPARLAALATAALPLHRRFDALLAMNPAYGGALGALGRALGGPPYLAWAYGFELLKSRGTPLAAVYRQVFRRARAAIAISGYTASLLVRLGVPEDRIRIVPPGADPPAIATGDSESVRQALSLPPGRIILTVGRLIARKGHLTLLTAMRSVMSALPDVLWVVAGRGPLLERLRAETAGAGIGPRVALLGYVDPAALTALYRIATVFALTPQASAGDVEGFGIVFLEAGARGLPVVAGRSGGVEDAVADGETGLLVDPSDPAAIAAALLRILADPALCTRLGEGGQAFAARHSWDAAALTIEHILEGPAPS